MSDADHDEWCPLNGCRCGKCGPCAQMPECPTPVEFMGRPVKAPETVTFSATPDREEARDE